MRFVDLLGMSLNSLRRRKLRTALTVLGVVIGTASVVVMMSLGIGMKELNREMISSYGSLTAITVYGQDAWGSSDSDKPLYLTDDVVKQFSGMSHVKSVYPLLEVNAIFIQGKYTMSANLTGVPDGYLAEIPLGQGKLPKAGDREMKLIYGNAVIRWFQDGKSNNWDFSDDAKLPDVDLMGKPMFVVFDTDAYYQSQGT
ncbi:ABC transporter permease, partial [Brotaphodocola sp.]|uniref:ABC transporter permease n=1 Tax=Brotaphodocola sp. TaxID=3073577 RepID=UPI003D7CBB17